ncbi:LysM domain-containing protein, partial [Sporichthya polymorpha]|uniref:LysM domain-containing protein n=1 Tax=Sporichthya polymorpha TaxID=35751 RepID=UPI00146D124E
MVMLAAFVVGPPVALLTFVGNPMPEQAVVGGRLTDDAVIGMLAAVVWIAWAQFALAVLTEVAAAARSAPLPRSIPLSGPHQQLARHLVLAASFLLAGGVTLTAPAATAVATPTTALTAPCVPDAAAAPARAIELPTVHPPGSASPPAENRDRTAAEATVPPQRIKQPDPQAQDRSPDLPAGRWYVVQPPHGSHHDTLWDIAERHLGDGLRWREIYDLNRGRPQPGGGELHLPRLIHPGWRLLLPPDATGLPEPEQPRSTRPAAAAKPHATTALSAADDLPDTVVGPGNAEVVERVAPPADGDRAGRTARAPTDTTNDPTDAESPIAVGALTLGLSAIACAGLTAELARRRRRAQRFRRPGERLRAPAEDAAALERRLRTANAATAIAGLRQALHQLAETRHATGQQLPDLQVVRINPARATLHLAADDPDPPGPFTPVDARTWAIDLTDGTEASGVSQEIEDPVDPCPALVAVGVSDSEVVLVNLEAAATLRILGPASEATAILHAIAAEAGTSNLTQSAEIVLSGIPSALENVVDAGRTRGLAPTLARRWAAARQRDIAALLSEAGLADLLAARARQVLSDTWAPGILIEGETASGDGSADQPRTGLSLVPYRGCSLITTHPAAEGEPPGWTLTPTDTAWRLEPLGIDLDPQRLDRAQLTTAGDLLDITVEPAPTSPLPGPVVLAD